MGTNTYTGFHNIAFSGSVIPVIFNNANVLGADTFQLCQGQFAIFESQYPADSYQWNFNGAIANPGNVQFTTSTQFNTVGFFPVTLNLITDCCGLSATKTIYLYVDRIPNPTGSGAGSICAGNARTLTLSGLNASDSVVWSPSTGILSSTANTITVSPSATTTYTASVYTRTTTNGRIRLSCPTNINFLVTVNNLPTMSISSTQPTCGNNGSLTSNITSGGGLYNFVWSNGGSTFNATNSTINTLAAGVYSVTATNTTTGCTVTDSRFLFPAPASPNVFLQSSAPATCGLNNGTATVSTSGGTAPFNYAWSSGGVGNNRTNLAPGNYCVTVTDGNTCRSTVCFNVTTPGTVNLNVLSTTNSTCSANGMATVEGTGGQGVITYLWSNGETTATATALPVGSSTVTATDAAGCSATTSIALTGVSASTAPAIAAIAGTVCPNTDIVFTASGGTAGTGSNIYWYTGPNGTGTALGTGASITVTAASASTTVYARRQGTCNTTGDDSETVATKTYIYAANGTSTNTYCTDNAGWHHFYVGDNIIFSTRGNLSNAPAGFPVATIWDNGTYYQNGVGPNLPASCVNGWSPGEERFEMERSWDLNLGGGAPIGTYQIRFYYQPAERTAIENAAINWMATYPACGYSYKYAVPLGFYWFKDNSGPYTAPIFDGTHYAGTIGTTFNGINYSEWAGIPSFSGGAAAVILIPNGLLPVEWQSFTGHTDGHSNYLNWTTASEENTSFFEVQRSQDGIQFQTIGKVDAKGFSTELSSYEFNDYTPFVGINYYRLRLVDLDAAESISSIVALNIEKDANPYVFYPNPTENSVYYQFNSTTTESVEIEIIDVLGRTLDNIKAVAIDGSNRILIHLNNYPDGNYLIRAQHLSSGIARTTKITKKSN